MALKLVGGTEAEVAADENIRAVADAVAQAAADPLTAVLAAIVLDGKGGWEIKVAHADDGADHRLELVGLLDLVRDRVVADLVGASE